MRDSRALRNLSAFLSAVTLILGLLGLPIGWNMEPAAIGATFFVAASICVLISTVLFVGCAVLTALIELGKDINQLG